MPRCVAVLRPFGARMVRSAPVQRGAPRARSVPPCPVFGTAAPRADKKEKRMRKDVKRVVRAAEGKAAKFFDKTNTFQYNRSNQAGSPQRSGAGEQIPPRQKAAERGADPATAESRGAGVQIPPRQKAAERGCRSRHGRKPRSGREFPHGKKPPIGRRSAQKSVRAVRFCGVQRQRSFLISSQETRSAKIQNLCT